MKIDRRETKKTVLGKEISRGDSVVTIKECIGSNGLINEFIAECSVCSLDQQLWPYGSLVYNTVNINREEYLCGCSRSVAWKRWQLELQISRMIEGGDLKFSGWVGGKYKGKDTKMMLTCPEGEVWKTTMGNFRKQSTPVFSKGHKERCKIEDNIKTLENSDLLPKHYKYSYSKATKKYLVSCSVCDNDPEFKSLGNKLYPSRLSCLKIGRKPCRCSPTHKLTQEERLLQISRQIERRGLTKVRIPKELNSRSRVVWVCSRGHVQNSKLNDFVMGCGCFECSKLKGGWYGYYPERVEDDDNLYLIKFTHSSNKEVFYKVGRSFNIKERIRKMTKDYETELVSSIQNNHQNIYDTEQNLHHELKNFQHYVEFYFKGCVGECFTPEILNHPEIISIFNLKEINNDK